MKIWISRSGKIYGPYSISSINNFLSGSLLFLDDWAWTTGLDNSWITLIQILRSNKVITTSTENLPFVRQLSSTDLNENVENVRQLVEKGELKFALDLVIGLRIPEIYTQLLKDCSISERNNWLNLGVWSTKDLSFVLGLLANCLEDAEIHPSLQKEKIHSLTLPQNIYLQDLEPLSSFYNLKDLDLSGNRAIKGISPILKLPLESLILKDCKSIENFEEISFLKSLKTLSLEGCTQLRSLKFLEEFENLETLSLSDTGLSSEGNELRKLNNLKKLYLKGECKIDFKALPDVPKLVSLFVWNQKLNNFSFLSHTTSIEKLSIVSCSFSDFHSAAKTWPHFPQLKDLQLCSSHILNLDFLKKNDVLDRLDIWGCKHLGDVSTLYGLKSLTSLRVTEKGQDWSYRPYVDNQIDEFAELQVEEAGDNPPRCYVSG